MRIKKSMEKGYFRAYFELNKCKTVGGYVVNTSHDYNPRWKIGFKDDTICLDYQLNGSKISIEISKLKKDKEMRLVDFASDEYGEIFVFSDWLAPIDKSVFGKHMEDYYASK